MCLERSRSFFIVMRCEVVENHCGNRVAKYNLPRKQHNRQVNPTKALYLR